MNPTSYQFIQHANADDLLFPYDGNKDFFLGKMKTILLPHINLMACCLMTNHFHLLFTPKEILKKSSQAVSNLMNSNAKSYNKLYQRKGSLFLKHPKFVEVSFIEDIKRTIKYIHRNPIHHGVTAHYHVYEWCLYNDVIYGKSEFVDVAKVLEIFGGIDMFKQEHEEYKG